MRPPTVVRLTNQLYSKADPSSEKTQSEAENSQWAHLNTVADPLFTFMKERNAKDAQNSTDTTGRPLLVHLAKMRGA